MTLHRRANGDAWDVGGTWRDSLPRILQVTHWPRSGGGSQYLANGFENSFAMLGFRKLRKLTPCDNGAGTDGRTFVNRWSPLL